MKNPNRENREILWKFEPITGKFVVGQRIFKGMP
jgi:hypothetical protein